jgi:Skp family chaperone for outer membrane proteins
MARGLPRELARRGMDAGPAGGSTELEDEERKTVKRYLLFVAGIAALTTAAYCGAALWAQPALGGGVAPAGTKIGVVNVGTVFTKYKKAQDFKDELQTAIKPFKDKADGWRKDMIQYQDAIQSGKFQIDGKTYSKESLEKGILDRKRALEDMDREVRNLVGKKQEDQLVQLWKEVTGHIRAYGASKGFHMVFGYGDPMDPKEWDTFPNINRKMQGMDLGAVCPLYVANGLDISEDVALSLNAALQQSRPAGPAVGGAGGVAPKGPNGN